MSEHHFYGYHNYVSLKYETQMLDLFPTFVLWNIGACLFVCLASTLPVLMHSKNQQWLRDISEVSWVKKFTKVIAHTHIHTHAQTMDHNRLNKASEMLKHEITAPQEHNSDVNTLSFSASKYLESVGEITSCIPRQRQNMSDTLQIHTWTAVIKAHSSHLLLPLFPLWLVERFWRTSRTGCQSITHTIPL